MGGGQSTYDYGYRIYNPAIGKFLSVDPLTADYPWYTPYQFAGNKPIWCVDLDGLEEFIATEEINCTWTYRRNPTYNPNDPSQVGMVVPYYQGGNTGAWFRINPIVQSRINGWNVLNVRITPPKMAIKKTTSEETKRKKKTFSESKKKDDEKKKDITTDKEEEAEKDKEEEKPYEIKTLNIGVDFDIDEADFDSPTSSAFGSDPLDLDLKETIGILKKNPNNFVSIKVCTSDKGPNDRSSNFGTTLKLLEARKQAVIDEFKRLAPDLKPGQVKVYFDKSSYNSKVGFTGTVTEYKK